MRQTSYTSGEVASLIARFAEFRARWRSAVEGIVRAGQVLIEAKAALPHGHFLDLVADLNLGERKAQCLMNISRNEVISNLHHWCAFPPSWQTLAELATMRPRRVLALIASGGIKSTMTHEEAIRLTVDKSQNIPPLPIEAAVGTLLAICTRHAGLDQIRGHVHELQNRDPTEVTPAEINAAIAWLRERQQEASKATIETRQTSTPAGTLTRPIAVPVAATTTTESTISGWQGVSSNAEVLRRRRARRG